jgi:hypothetical protein
MTFSAIVLLENAAFSLQLSAISLSLTLLAFAL